MEWRGRREMGGVGRSRESETTTSQWRGKIKGRRRLEIEVLDDDDRHGSEHGGVVD